MFPAEMKMGAARESRAGSKAFERRVATGRGIRTFLWRSLVCAGTAAILLLSQNHARGGNREVHITEIMAGANGDARIQFIVLEQGADGENLWGPQGSETQSRAMLVFSDGFGRETGIFKFPSNPPTGGTLRTLLATEQFSNLPGAPSPDIVIPPLLNAWSGKVCFRNNPSNGTAEPKNECVSYGSYTGEADANRSGAGGPPAPSLSILNTVSLRRGANTGRNSDFSIAAQPVPVNIAGATFTIPVASAVVQGEALFNNETFAGNGRTCASCHVAADSFRLTPANVQERFAALSSATPSFDPLFIGEWAPSAFDAGFDFNLNTLLLEAEVSTPAPCTGELRGSLTSQNGVRAKVLARTSATTYLIYGGANPALTGVVTDGACSATVAGIRIGDLAVPPSSSVLGIDDPVRMRSTANANYPEGRALILENIDGYSNPPVFRRSPHLLNLAWTAPYGFSSEIHDLRTFATTAVIQHFPRTLARNSSGLNADLRLPTPEELAALEAFLLDQEFPQVTIRTNSILRASPQRRSRERGSRNSVSLGAPPVTAVRFWQKQRSQLRASPLASMSRSIQAQRRALSAIFPANRAPKP